MNAEERRNEDAKDRLIDYGLMFLIVLCVLLFADIAIRV